MRAHLEMRVAARDWKNAAIAASNLSELQVTLGDLADAIEIAEQAVGHADLSGDEFQRMSKPTTLADAFHQAGRLGDARALFEKAEAIQAEWQPQYPRLYSLQGYQYCDLLLRPAEPPAWGRAAGVDRDAARRACNEARKRAAQTLEWTSRQLSLLTIALDHLTLGRAHAGLWRLTAGAGGADEAEGASHQANARTHLDEAVAKLRESGQTQYLALGLFHRAALRRLAGDECDAARADLDDAFEIADQGEMRLHLCDAHLGYAWLALEEKNPAEARKRAGAARDLIAATGYHRRDEELAALDNAIAEYQA
jgi:tetratricopeptide (TPR) repeat protein